MGGAMMACRIVGQVARAPVPSTAQLTRTSRHASRSGARRLAQRDRSDSGIAAPFRFPAKKRARSVGSGPGASSQSSTRLRRPFAPVWGSNRLQDRDGGRRAIVHEFGPPKGINRKVLIIHLLE